MTGAAAGGAGPQPQGEGPVAALDPGSAKCGLVLSDGARQRIVQALVVAPAEAERLLELWRQEPGLAAVVIGDGTGSGRWRERLAGRLPVVWQRERGSTLAARERYWQLFPPRSWRRWLPKGLRQPPRAWDDVVAQLLLERWLGRELAREPESEPEAGAGTIRTRPAR
jgi:RNase H-fold protein (predicted Holliday junction resolvase)